MSAKIPKIKLPVAQIMMRGDSYGKVSMDSLIPEAGYISIPGEGTLMVTATQGFLTLKEDEVPIVAEELAEIAEQMKIRKRLQDEDD